MAITTTGSVLIALTTVERYFELTEQTPYSYAVQANYQPSEEHVQEQNYKLELELRKLKRCL